MTAPARPRTSRCASEYAELSRTVRDARLLERRLPWYWARILGSTAAFLAGWAVFVVLQDSWFQLAVAAGLALVAAQFGFLGHDAAHRQIFASAACNTWAARLIAGGLGGLSHTWWASKHSRHHAAPNQEGKDPDIGAGVIAFTAQAAHRRSGVARWFTDRQGWLFFPLLAFEGLHLHVASFRVLLSRRDAPYRRLELGLITARLGANLAVVLLVLPVGKAAAFLALQVGLLGVFLGGSFAPNHKGMPVVPREAKLDFLRRQVLVSRNIDGGRLTDFAMGGLNYQVEHHLFPSMPRPNLRRAQPLVRAFCEERGVPYTQTSLLGSYAIVVRYLNRVGLAARDPFTCPLVERYRA
ncbi:fatty acid desaturase family protein [Motilibacter rhizosphaerae]|uniref:fatty acid desaturase family protein n=1 Tax=Motilibacter rhizosphaerae TaxID=598652 RepID=UPI0018C8AB81